jgi:hypothetical protein
LNNSWRIFWIETMNNFHLQDHSAIKIIYRRSFGTKEWSPLTRCGVRKKRFDS